MSARLANGRGRGRSEDEDALVARSDEDDSEENTSRFYFPSITSWYSRLNRQHALTVLILVYINLINYMDRSTVAGLLEKIKHDPAFNVHEDKWMGLLQTAFVVFYMLFAPLFGYLGDRHSRKWLLGVGVGFWCLAGLIGSFMTNFWAFLFFRAMVGIGEASYSTVAPAIISDMFSKDSRSTVLALFYFAIPVGTGLGYIVGSEVAGAVGDWRWGLRVTPVMGAIAVFLIIFGMSDPPRGNADGSHLRPTSVVSDLRALGKNKSFVLSTIAFTCVTYSAGALMWWGPQFAFNGAKSECGNKAGCDEITLADISIKFGIVMTLAGLIGVPVGSYVSQTLRHRVPNADPLVCAATLMGSVPLLFFGFITAEYSTAVCYGLTFAAGLLLNCNWAVVSDMTLYIVLPTRRGIASATQILVSHALGDAFSPYLIGALADAFKPLITPKAGLTSGETPEEYTIEFRGLQYALFTCCFFQIFGALFFFCMSWYILTDKARVDRQIASNADLLEPHADIVNTYADEPIYRPPVQLQQGVTQALPTAS